jgi:drug/metabolite transporter (DMT)-like permease
MLVGAGFVVMWSSGFIGARLGTQEAVTYTILMWRFLVATTILLIWLIWRLIRHTTRLTRREVAVQSVIGLFAQGVYLIGTVKAVELGLAAGTVALIAALQPVFSAAVAGPILGEWMLGRQWVGLGIGLLGVGLVVGGGLHQSHGVPAWAYLLPFVGMAGLVAATMVERRVGVRTKLADSLTVQCIANAVLFTVLSATMGQVTPPASDGFWLAVGWFVVFSTFGGYGFYWLGIRRIGVARVTSLIYLTPPTTMLWAFIMFGQKVTPATIAGVIVCLGSVLLASWSDKKETKLLSNAEPNAKNYQTIANN